MARRLLEAFLTFKVPGNRDAVEKVEELAKDDGCDTILVRAALRLLNTRSHFQVISNTDGVDFPEGIESLPLILSNVLDYIKANDKLHYDTLVEICSQYYEEHEPEAIAPRISKAVNLYYSMPVAAGSGTYLFFSLKKIYQRV